MPYIERKRRHELYGYIEALDDKLAEMGDVGGDMNFVIFRLLYLKWERVRKYMTAETMMGTLNCVGREFYRRCIAPYEDGAMWRNGDIL